MRNKQTTKQGVDMYSLSNPVHPGRVLKNMYMKPSELNITTLAEKLGVSTSAVSRLVTEKAILVMKWLFAYQKFLNELLKRG